MSEADADKQFQEDLERAKALSLESHALEEFKKKKTSRNSIATSTTKQVVKNGPTMLPKRSVGDILSRPPERSSSLHESTPRPRPSTLGAPMEVSKPASGKNVPPPRQFSLQHEAKPLHGSEDLISWSAPTNPKFDQVKSTVNELFKASTPGSGLPGSQPFSPISPLGNFNFSTDSRGFLQTQATPDQPGNSGPFVQPRTVFPVLNKVNRLEYNIMPHVSPHPSLGFTNNPLKVKTPFTPGYPMHMTMNQSPSSLQSVSPTFSNMGQGLQKSQSLSAFPVATGPTRNEIAIVQRLSNHISVSAHTSPVHQIVQKQPQFNRTQDFNCNTLVKPRQSRADFVDSFKPKSGQFQILPDKPKVAKTKQVSGKPNQMPSKRASVPIGGGLIDFSEDFKKSKEDRIITKVSVLEAFDPLLLSDDEDQDKVGSAMNEDPYFLSSVSEGSFYETYDPFEYMVNKAQQQTDTEIVGSKNVEVEIEDVPEGPILMSPRHRKSNYPNVYIHPSAPAVADEKTVERRIKEKEKFYEKTEIILGKCLLHKETDASRVDSEVRAFVNMVSELRGRFKHDDGHNPGIILSPRMDTLYKEGTSVKLVVRPLTGNASDHKNLPAVKFTCDVTSAVAHILWKVLMDLEEKGHQLQKDDQYILGVAGASEYICIDNDSKLQDYVYVHQCYKFDKDVELSLIQLSKLKRPLLRTASDDKSDSVVRAQDISPLGAVGTLSYDELKILMEILENESKRMSTSASQLSDCTDTAVMPALRPKSVIQAVKAVCALLGKVETLEVTDACERLIAECLKFDQSRKSDNGNEKMKPEIIDEKANDNYSTVVFTSVCKKEQQNYAKQIKDTLNRLKEVVQKLVETYTKTFRVNFSFQNNINNNNNNNRTVSIEDLKPKVNYEILETLLLRVCALHRLQPEWIFDSYMVTLEIYHGTCPITKVLESQWVSKSESFYERVAFDSWIETVRICSLPREARLVLNLFGRKAVIVEKQTRLEEIDIGWAAIQLFNFEQYLAQGSFLLPLWPSAETEKKVGPAPDGGSHPFADTCPLISIELPELSSPVFFPSNYPIQKPPRSDYDFKDLDFDTQQKLIDVCDQDIMTFTEYPAQDREVLWEKRYYLTHIPGALPKVLLAAHSWDYACLPSLYGLIEQWKKPAPMDVLQLFLPCFPDTHIRKVAIEWLEAVSCDQLIDFLPQLIEALKHETWCASPLAKLLLEKALMSPRVAHSLYWLLTQSLPGQNPQNSSYADDDANHLGYQSKMKIGRYKRRLQMMMRALYIISGQALRNSFLKQQEMIHRLLSAAIDVKQSKEGIRNTVLAKHLTQLNEHLRDDNPTLVPLSLGLIAKGVDPRMSSYFPSNTLPLELAFLSESDDIIPAMFKVGDDLRQDQLTIQMIRLMDKLWLREGLDLKMVTFACVPTGHRHGMVELVPEARTLREIQVNSSGRGVTGSFKDTPITEWLVKHNPSQLEFNTAVHNFTHSCAGYSIVTYILGICDRHNDNIMVKKTGHLFHIDFGKFLGDAQMIGNIKRDRTPFVLTPDMLHVINGGNKPTQKFQDFVELCCRGYNLIRKNGNLLLNLFALMASSGIPGVTHDAVSYVQRALSPDLSSTEAAASFARKIEESLSSLFTQVNFFFHNLAQLKFTENNEEDGSVSADGTGDQRNGRKSGELLSFVPKTYSLESDGRIEAVLVYGIQKRYQPEGHYLFILKITREHEKGATLLFRTYREFCELYSKLNSAYPKSGLPSLEKGLRLGRQEIREVAERRKHDIASFLERLFNLDERVSHSNLVYTFFHPLLRDEEETDIRLNKLKDDSSLRKNGHNSRQIQGKIKLSMEYRRNTFMVMVCHAKDLAVPDVSKEEPNSYVKVYLQPDPHKVTKRKTRVIHKNCHPSFMEMLEYRLPLDIVKHRTLQASIWNTDRFQENLFLGAVEIPLENLDFEDKSVVEWYPLKNLKRISGPVRHA